jgi:hypothetical protein
MQWGTNFLRICGRAIYDLDAKYCSILSRQAQLSAIFRDKEDVEGVQLCKNAGGKHSRK